MTTRRRFNPNPVLSPRYCPVHEQMERQECGLARTEYGREVVEERERHSLTHPLPKVEGPPSPTFEEQYPDRETERLRRELAEAHATIKKLRTPPPLPKQGGSAPTDALP